MAERDAVENALSQYNRLVERIADLGVELENERKKREHPDAVSNDATIERRILAIISVGIQRCIESTESPFARLPPIPLPLPYLHEMQTILRDTLNGVMPKAIEVARTPLRRRHRPPRAEEERNAIFWAVAYVRAAKDQLIDDNSPVLTVARAYSVEKRTVQDWVRQYKHITTESISLADVPKDRSLGEYVAQAMPFYGDKYRVSLASRSWAAQARRGRPRTQVRN